MFGSTVEYVLTYNKLSADDIVNDGSMHGFSKMLHIYEVDQLIKHTSKISAGQDLISTITYPYAGKKFSDILELVNFDNCKNILIRADNISDCELNLLFQYYKVVAGEKCSIGIYTAFGDPHEENNVKQWNTSYNCLEDLKPWEYREWFSYFYPKFVNQWIDSQDSIDDTFLTVINSDLLNNPYKVLTEISEFLDVEIDISNLHDFADRWKKSQEYIVNKFNNLNSVVKSSINNVEYTWEPMSIIEEGIVQNRLRKSGYEIKCNNLDIFPTSSTDLHKLIFKA